jgi:predicted enzyme related to lactoylglutathione lyase
MNEKTTFTVMHVRDLDLSTAFFRDMLGMAVAQSSPNSTRFTSNGARLILKAKGDRLPGDSSENVRLALSVTDLDGLYRRLCGRSVKFASPPQRTELGLEATVLDPEGNRVDLIEWSEPEEITDHTIVNDILKKAPEAMEVFEEHGIRICGGCIVLLNGSVQETAEYSGLLHAESTELVKELNDKIHPHA